MLTIDIKINGRRIAGATVENVSGLADLADYNVAAVEQGSTETGHPSGWGTQFKVVGHKRRQSVWALIYLVAARAMLQREAEARRGAVG